MDQCINVFPLMILMTNEEIAKRSSAKPNSEVVRSEIVGGVDLRYIQNFLGHESTRTTQIYTHITKKGIEKIRSPLDNLDI